MKLTDFVKLYPMRAENMGWFFGAGTAASAGIPTAFDMIWDFKRRIFCADEGLNVSNYSNLSSSPVRFRIQSYFDSAQDTPITDSPEEYSYYFERYLPNEKDRAEYISRMIADSQPSYGHKVMATLMKMSKINFIVTTNFDKEIENVAAHLYRNVGSLFVAGIENNASAIRYIQDRKIPLLIKLHGDYHSLKLKNTSTELQNQDSQLRKALKQICLQQGMAVIGYSGRDNSVMDVFEEAIEDSNAFPQGLFWFKKNDSPILERVQNLIIQAEKNGIEAAIIESETFDDTFSALIKGFEKVPAELQTLLDKTRDRLSIRPIPEAGKNFPVIRLNALPIVEYPTIARLIQCDIGGFKEMKEAIDLTNANIIAIRKKEGIIGFGNDSEFDKAFSSFNITKKEVYQISDKPLAYEESSIKNLILNAFCTALTKYGKLLLIRKRSDWYIIPDPKYIDDDKFKILHNLSYKSYGKNVFHKLIGTIPDTRLKWIDAIKVSLSFNFSTLFLIINPSIIAQKIDNLIQTEKAAAFIKEQIARRLNEGYNEILNGWILTLFPKFDINNEAIVETFDEISGINASFKIIRRTSFSKKI